MFTPHTERLFHQNPRQAEFDAAVIERRDDGRTLILDQTCFYPESGGQLPDEGTLNGIRVVDVQEDGEAIVHFLERGLVEDTVHGVVDWEVRFDHMQQHTGQHILSQAFLRVVNGRTVGFHMGKDSCTVDIRTPHLAPEVAERTEELANGVIFDDRLLAMHLADRDECKNFPLRKPPPDVQRVRIVEVKDYDFSACSGTHCETTGQVGIIKIVRWEKIRGDVRVEFLCGWRALRDYRWKNEVVNRMAASLTVRGRDLEGAFARLREENADREKKIKDLMGTILGHEANALVEATTPRGSIRIITSAIPGRTLEELRALASRVVEHCSCVALLATRTDRTHLVFARSRDLTQDMRSLMAEGTERIQGKGGGSPEFAQGGGPAVPDLLPLLHLLSERISV